MANNGDTDQQARSWLARVVSWLSALLVLALVGFLVYEALSPMQPPVFDVRLGELRAHEDRFYLPLTVTNRGGQSVQGLELKVTLSRATEEVASSSVTFDWLPSHSSRRAAVVFDRDPARYNVATEIQGYLVP